MEQLLNGIFMYEERRGLSILYKMNKNGAKRVNVPKIFKNDTKRVKIPFFGKSN